MLLIFSLQLLQNQREMEEMKKSWQERLAEQEAANKVGHVHHQLKNSINYRPEPDRLGFIYNRDAVTGRPLTFVRLAETLARD